MMRNFSLETENRVRFIRQIISDANADGIVYGNSGGKDSALVGILCKFACENTVGLIMPCGSNRNYHEDKNDAEQVAKQYNIVTKQIDLSELRSKFICTIAQSTHLTDTAIANIAPRLRMTTLYAVAASENRLVAGTGNRSERHMGYFTKWGDGACDFNPIADLTVTEIYEFLRYLQASESIISKAPSAGLFDGQTDEGEMGVTYRSIDAFLLGHDVSERDLSIIEKHHQSTSHKRKDSIQYTDENLLHK